MKRTLLVLFSLALIMASDAAAWVVTAVKSCPGKCPLCP